ncbi:PREDICTED: holotricin-2-like [Nicrophorus vespilloides]|uniref:Holotricin-2-like n=1 Tax=Nicrophorus vespilloides TaxID=110193 RepID=A0ABM1NB56_NICVS|nr:PREDICTED: holotricin-2-like [Nicrophorus vespilloides]
MLSLIPRREFLLHQVSCNSPRPKTNSRSINSEHNIKAALLRTHQSNRIQPVISTNMLKLSIFLFALATLSHAYVTDYYPESFYSRNGGEQVIFRHRRSFAPGAPSFPFPKTPTHTEVNPHIKHGADGTTNAGASIHHVTKDYEVHGKWSKNVDGPGKSKAAWGVSGIYRL